MAASAGSQHRCVFVGNIPYDATEEQLIQICEEVGPVVSFRLVVDRDSGKPKGYGFCEYKDEETALSARRNLQGYEINGRQLRVDFAENDKGSDRNREQGRGGPGLTPHIDAQKSKGGAAVPGDPALRQPIGIPLAATSATVMAGALGGSQTASFSSMQNGLQNQSALGNDPLTHYLGATSRYQLNEILSEMKALATNNKSLAQQLLRRYAQLPKSLFQAEIMLGLVSPQLLQMAKTRQSSTSVQQPVFPNGVQDLKPTVPYFPGQSPIQMPLQSEVHGSVLLRPPESLLPNIPQNLAALQQSSTMTQDVRIQPRFPHQIPPQAQVSLQEMVPGSSGIAKIPSAQPQVLGGFPVLPQTTSLASSKGLMSQVQPSVMQHPRAPHLSHHAQQALPHASLQQSLLTRPPSSQAFAGGVEMLPNGAGSSTSAGHELAWASRTNMRPSSGVGSMESSSDMSELIGRPAKLARLDHGSFTPRMMTTADALHNKPVAAPLTDTGSVSGSQIVGGDGMQQSEKQTAQLAPEVESVLLQQVMNLTPEQLSSLPLDQRQQVLELQKAFSSNMLPSAGR